MKANGSVGAIGLMSGTSMDGIDIAFIETDGEWQLGIGPWQTRPYPAGLRRELLALRGDRIDVGRCETAVTDACTRLIKDFCSEHGLLRSAIDVVGFHGQTIRHDPSKRLSWQLGDGARMALEVGCLVVNQFRANDIEHGGQGAPLAPAYHRVLTRSLDGPLAVLNVGGVSNITWIDGPDMVAFDSGPGNAMLDDWVAEHYGVTYDDGGRIAAAGTVDAPALRALLDHPYFTQRGPKSLDRNAFSLDPVRRLSPADGAATLLAFAVGAVAAGRDLLPSTPQRWIVVGGGRQNTRMMAALESTLAVPVVAAEAVGWIGDAIEAQAFAYLAVRSMKGLPLTWPGTTGVSAPTTGGVHHRPPGWHPASGDGPP
jgi:anhydro-N-acetylmuramic acid kinase